MFIGDIEIPIVSDVEEGSASDVDEISSLSIDRVAVKHEPGLREITFDCFLNEQLHSESLTLDEQKKQVKSLRTREVDKNSFNYKDYKGHLLIEDINFIDNSESVIVDEVIIDARYFPWPKYFPESEP